MGRGVPKGAGPVSVSVGIYGRNLFEESRRGIVGPEKCILVFSKIETGKTNIVEDAYKLSSVLKDVSDMIFFKAQEKGLQFILDVDGTLPHGLYGDAAHVHQVITNILTNAVKYTDRGSIRMVVRSEGDDRYEAGRTLQLIIAVRDTGIGIKPADIEKLFTKFQRIDLTNNSTIESTGLGLAITRSLLEMMGGTIQVESEYGKGSEFTVRLPQKVVSCESVGDIRARFEEHMQDAKVYEETFRAPSAHILIVDDTPMNLTVAVGLLKSTEMQIDTAAGGDEALALTMSNANDLILMDQRMPKMDGVEALRHIQRQTDGLNRETPVICLTADAIIGARERYMAEGFTDYLTKPIDSQALERMLIKYLPDEKMLPVSRRDRTADTRTDENLPENYAPMHAVGIDPSVGLRYCQGDDAIYRALLEEYAHGLEEKVREMQKYMESGDLENYAILVHVVKSSSRMIGASELSELAADLEKAADDGRMDVVERGFPRLKAWYEAASAAIIHVLPSADESSPADDDIMEFFPEAD